jgi:nucleoid-associated protein YgaU
MAMRDRSTEHLEPYEPADPGYEWEYDDERAGRAPAILWGRVAVLALFLLLAFLIGRITAGGDSGIAQARFNEVRAERDAASDRVASLETQVADLEQQIADTETENQTPPEEESPTGDEEPAAEEPEGEPYTIESGDTLVTIAEEYYDNPALDDYIAEHNGITDPSLIQPGQEIIIPPEP